MYVFNIFYHNIKHYIGLRFMPTMQLFTVVKS